MQTAESRAETTSAVRFDHVYKAFVGRGRGSDAVLALQDVTFDAKPGEFISLVGPSGCGKSTCLNLLAGLSSRPTARSSPRQPGRGINTSVGYITQDDNLLPWRSLRGNVETGLELRGVERPSAASAPDDFIHLVGLRGFEDHYPHELSGGMRKRAGHHPHPGLRQRRRADGRAVRPARRADPGASCRTSCLKFWERSRPTVLFVTHDLVEAIALSDRILVFTVLRDASSTTTASICLARATRSESTRRRASASCTTRCGQTSAWKSRTPADGA